MKGIRTYSERRFGELFNPLFDSLRGHSWLALSSSFHYPPEWLDTSTYDEATETYTAGPIKDFEADVAHVGDVTPMTRKTFGYSAVTDIFPKFAAAVSEDWCSIFGIARPVADPRRWFEDYYAANNRAQYLCDHSDVVFLSVDGSFWECFTGRDELLQRLSAHLAALKIAVENVELSNLDYL